MLPGQELWPHAVQRVGACALCVLAVLIYKVHLDAYSKNDVAEAVLYYTIVAAAV